jgi:hypothetical protein
MFLGLLDPDPNPDALVRGMDPPKNVMDPHHWIKAGFRIRIDLMRI